jgi:hypothetical protein
MPPPRHFSLSQDDVRFDLSGPVFATVQGDAAISLPDPRAREMSAQRKNGLAEFLVILDGVINLRCCAEPDAAVMR